MNRFESLFRGPFGMVGSRLIGLPGINPIIEDKYIQLPGMTTPIRPNVPSNPGTVVMGPQIKIPSTGKGVVDSYRSPLVGTPKNPGEKDGSSMLGYLPLVIGGGILLYVVMKK